MIREHDSQIVDRLLATKDNVSLFCQTALDVIPLLKDDASYWQVLATSWIFAGRTSEIAIWRPLFSADRHRRWKLMKKKDRKVWRKLPAVVNAYRASEAGEDLDAVISWTLDRSVAERFAQIWGRTVVERRFRKEQVIAFFDRRQEREIIVLA